jgi:hypothetical protein
MISIIYYLPVSITKFYFIIKNSVCIIIIDELNYHDYKAQL